MDGAGERGKTTSSDEKTGVGGTRTVKVVVEGDGDDGDAGVEGEGDGALDCPEGKTVGKPAVVPWLWKVRMTASHAVSRACTRSRSAQFSASRAASAACWSGLLMAFERGWTIPARRALFSASSSTMRASRAENCALRLSRLC